MRAAHLTCFLAIVALVVPSPAVHAGTSFDHVVSLGDSLLDDPSGNRSPLVSEHLAARLGAPLTQLAVAGATSTSLIAGGQHTTAAANFGAGDLAVLWIGGNDFFANSNSIELGNFSFLDTLEANVELALATLVGAGMDVVVLNLPDFALVPNIILNTPSTLLPQFTAASADWRSRLDALAASYGAAVVDVFSLSQQISGSPSAFALAGNEPVPGPAFGGVGACPFCIFFDPIHPSSLGQGFVTNQAIADFNAHFVPGGTAALSPLDEEELLSLVMDTGSWTVVGGGTPGVQGVPDLAGSGALVDGATVSIDLTDGPPAALSLLWLSTSSTPLQKFGGTIHAFPVAAQFLLPTNPAGGFSASTTWPPGVPSGAGFWFQFLCQDGSVPPGITLSDAVKATAP
jgi:hypothetical protein